MARTEQAARLGSTSSLFRMRCTRTSRTTQSQQRRDCLLLGSSLLLEVHLVPRVENPVPTLSLRIKGCGPCVESPYKAAAKVAQRALTQKCSTLQVNYHRRFITLQLTGLMNYWYEGLQRDAFKRGRRERPEIILMVFICQRTPELVGFCRAGSSEPK